MDQSGTNWTGKSWTVKNEIGKNEKGKNGTGKNGTGNTTVNPGNRRGIHESLEIENEKSVVPIRILHKN